MRIPTITGGKVETLYFDIFYTQCLEFLSPSNVSTEDLPKSVCLVKKKCSQMFCFYLLTHFSQLHMSFLGMQVFILPGKQKGRKQL